MGLDQYIFQEIEGEYEDDGRTKVEEIHYWRKNYQLNDWACWNWCPDGMADFNCERLTLEEYMIDDLIEHIIYNLDKPNKDDEGFDGLISENVLEAFKDFKLRVKNGKTLYYYAWW